MAVCGLIPSFRKEAKGIVLSFGANERTKENIHPHQGLPPILGGFKQRIAETANSLWVLVSRDTA